jgi:hypothetical protein
MFPPEQRDLERLKAENEQLRQLVEELLGCLRVATFDEAPGEREVYDRALTVLASLQPR